VLCHSNPATGVIVDEALEVVNVLVTKWSLTLLVRYLHWAEVYLEQQLLSTRIRYIGKYFAVLFMVSIFFGQFLLTVSVALLKYLWR
jgi:amino acid permease